MDETAFTKTLRSWVKDKGGCSYKLGASLFLAKGIPDAIYFLDNTTFLLESKVYPNRPSKIQLEQIRRIRAGTGYAWVITEMKDGSIILDETKFNTLGDVFIWIVSYIKDRINAKKTM